MAEFYDCSTKVDIPTLLKSLIGVNAAGDYVFRIDSETGTNTDAVTCDTKDEFWALFRRAISLADDGLPALRVIITDDANGANTSLPACGVEEDWETMLRRCFVLTDQGEVAVNLVNIT
jgi:hypothetical protein